MIFKRLGLSLALAAVLVAVLSSGCALLNRPLRSPARPDVPARFRSEPTISLFVSETGQVRRLKLEEYLEGVVASEMDPDWPEAALEAQAILARTFTLKKIQQGGVRKRGTDASTDEKEFQAYDASRVNDRVRRAVKSTRGQVLLFRGRLVNAWFHASSGGMTATPREGLDFRGEATPYLKPVRDPASQEGNEWSARFSKDQIRKALSKLGAEVGEFDEARIVRKGPSGRAMLIRFGNRTVSGPELRTALGREEMRSTLLTGLAVTGDDVVMRGRGYGHGVGMSQVGAASMARRGNSAHDILKFYFKGVDVAKLWK